MADINKILENTRARAKEQGNATVNSPVDSNDGLFEGGDPKAKAFIPVTKGNIGGCTLASKELRPKACVATKNLINRLISGRTGSESVQEASKNVRMQLMQKGYTAETAPYDVIKSLAGNYGSDPDDVLAVLVLANEMFKQSQSKSSFISVCTWLNKEYGNGKIPVQEGLMIESYFEDETGTDSSFQFKGSQFSTIVLTTKTVLTRRDMEDTAEDIITVIAKLASDSQTQKLERTVFSCASNISHDNIYDVLDEKRTLVANDYLNAEHLAALREKLSYDAYNQNGSFIMSRDMKISALSLKNDRGEYVYKQSFEQDRPDLILGRKVYCSDYIPSVTGTIGGDNDVKLSNIIFADLSKILIITSPTVELIVDPYGSNAENGTISFYVRKRYAIKMPIKGALAGLFNVGLSKAVSEIDTISSTEFTALKTKLKAAVPDTSLENM